MADPDDLLTFGSDDDERMQFPPLPDPQEQTERLIAAIEALTAAVSMLAHRLERDEP